MNGADDDEVYKIVDEGKWANLKVRALQNIIDARLPLNTGTIIVKGVNEHTLKRQVDLITELVETRGINFNTTSPYNRIVPVVRLKSVGAIGRYMENSSYNMDELINLTMESLKINHNQLINVAAGVNRIFQKGKMSSYMIPYYTKAGKIFIRLADWETDDDGVVDNNNPDRGRLTQNWTVAPFFEHVKLNEYGY